MPNLSRDGHWLFFSSTRPGRFGNFDIWVSWRANPHDDFGWETPVNLGAINTDAFDAAASPLMACNSSSRRHLAARPGSRCRAVASLRAGRALDIGAEPSRHNMAITRGRPVSRWSSSKDECSWRLLAGGPLPIAKLLEIAGRFAAGLSRVTNLSLAVSVDACHVNECIGAKLSFILFGRRPSHSSR